MTRSLPSVVLVVLGLAHVLACGADDVPVASSQESRSCRGNGGSCDDGNPCTARDVCIRGKCVGEPYTCDHSNPCTAEACDGAGGCTVQPLTGIACDDGNACTVDDACTAGVCAGVVPAEICGNGVDDNCDGLVDEGCAGDVPPAEPSNARAYTVSSSAIDVYWSDNSSSETGFEIHRSADGPAGTFALVGTHGPDVTAARDAGLSAGTEYCYKVRAVRTSAGTTIYSGFSNTACAATATTPPPPPPPPNAPSGTSVTPLGSDGVNVTWIDNSDNEDWFRVEHAPASTGPWEFIGTWLSSAYTSWVTYGLPSEQQICYRVIAVNAYGASAPSNVDCTTPPATPNPLTALWSAGPAVDLTWTDNSSVEDGYQVRRRASGEPWIDIAELPPNATSYRDASVSAGGTYFYVVRARKDGGFSYPSWEATPTDGTPRPPVAPWLDAPQGYYLGTIWLFWYSNPADVDGFQIERCDNEVCAEADFTLITTVPVSPSYTHSYQDVVGDWWIYTYRVRAYNEVGVSPPSNQAQGRTCIDGVDWESPCVPPLPSPP